MKNCLTDKHDENKDFSRSKKTKIVPQEEVN